MNKRQKEIQQSFLDNEKAVLKKLEVNYQDAIFEINDKIEKLMARDDANLQNVIYQVEYQKALKKQVEGILESLHSNEFTTVSEYLTKAYEDGFIGTMYDMQGQGIPIVVPIDQKQVVIAIQHETKLSEGLYAALGKDTSRLSKQIAAEISRGISNAATYAEIARNIASFSNIPKNNAARIARTEAHRIQNKATADAQWKAKEKGADVVKQWDSTLDGKTRDSHRKLDGQIRELDEPFEVEGKKAMQPGDFGDPAEDCNCRCALLQRARWAIGEDELNTLQDRAAFFGLDKNEDFEDFKEKYLHLPENADKIKTETLPKPTGSENPTYDAFFKTLNNRLKVAYNAVENHKKKMTPDDIIEALSGGDLTSGSCASLGLAYIGQKQGWDVIDYRGGESQSFFSNGFNLMQLSQTDGLKVLTAEGKAALTVGNRLLKQCEAGKEYYLCVGRHASIVRKLEDGKLQYLELQSARNSGWTDFNANPRFTLSNRFGCSSNLPSVGDFMIDIDDSEFKTDDFKQLLGYINTAGLEQKKGKYGTVK